MESNRHKWLKTSALKWLIETRWQAAAREVVLPGPRLRADVAGWREEGDRCQTVLIECKATRSDFLRDGQDVRDLLERREALHRAIEQAGVPVRRLLCAGQACSGTLFDQVPTDRFAGNAADLRRMRCTLMAVNRRLHPRGKGAGKLAKLAWWGAADACWIAVPAGLLKIREVPSGWGLLEFDRHGQVRVALEAPELASSLRWREGLLRGIARASTRDWARQTLGNVSGGRG
ncbi:MAG: hypothetical protein MK101_03940 [Phycisphaerales bacterium]|nr:hypothetical protein [Phycisphaerales bacterium]